MEEVEFYLNQGIYMMDFFHMVIFQVQVKKYIININYIFK